MTTSRRWGLTIGAAGLLLAACVPEFANPVTGGSAADPALLGEWRAAPEGTGEDQIMILEIVPSGDGILVTLRDPDPGASGEAPIKFKGRTGVTPAGQHFANLKPQEDGMEDSEMGYLLFRYEMKGDGGKVWPLDTTRLAASIDSGTIAGTTSGSGTDTSAKVTASSDVTAAFLDTPEGRSLQLTGPGDPLVLTRMTP
jgi:hypothetical protein